MTVEDVLKNIVHPAKDKDIVSLGLVDNIVETEEKISLRLNFKAPDAAANSIKKACKEALEASFPGKEIDIFLLVNEQTKQEKKPLEMGKEQIANIKHIIAVASGKGGVGKSTVAVNLATALAKEGYKVGLADADIYGPSIPKMTATEDVHPYSTNEDGQDLILPIQKYGIKWMSIGYFIPAEQAVIWRGPMAANALKQMLLQVRWGELDFLLIDMPPGTGDIQISLVNDIPLTGAIVVSTPQELALADVEKSINMFMHKDLNIRVLGLVENMAWFTPEDMPEKRYYIFGKEGTRALAEKYKLPLLCQIPLKEYIREGGDKGVPEAFIPLAHAIVKEISSL